MSENENMNGSERASENASKAIGEVANAHVTASEGAGEHAPAKTPAERGEALGEQIAALEAEQASDAAAPAGKEADRKKHIGVIVAVVAFAVLLIVAGVAYGALAPTADNQGISTTTPAQGADKTMEGANSGSSKTDNAAATEQESSQGNNAAATETDANADAADEQATAAPDFTMTDASGKTLTMADFRGKPVLLNFWASWCGPCASEMPDIQKAWEEHGDEVEFVIVNMTGMSGETEQTAKDFLSQNGYTFPCYFDVDSSAASAYGVASIPQSYLIDAEGNIIGGYMGAMNSAVLDEGIAMLTGAAEVPTAQ